MKVNSIRFYPKQEILSTWVRDKERHYRPDAKTPPKCLRCGAPLHHRLVENALSRGLNVYICSDCGVDEGLRDACGRVLPLREWYAVKNGLLEDIGDNHSAILTAECNFRHIFSGPQKTLPLNSMERPVSELAYSRSDYDGYKWWTTWFHCQEERPERELVLELDAFQQALFKLPEFHTLWSMQIMCPLYAEATSDRTEYNLYSETERFYIWLRLISRERDYNVYVHYYLKYPEQNNR